MVLSLNQLLRKILLEFLPFLTRLKYFKLRFYVSDAQLTVKMRSAGHDANQLISHLLSYLKRKALYLHQLSSSPPERKAPLCSACERPPIIISAAAMEMMTLMKMMMNS